MLVQNIELADGGPLRKIPAFTLGVVLSWEPADTGSIHPSSAISIIFTLIWRGDSRRSL